MLARKRIKGMKKILFQKNTFSDMKQDLKLDTRQSYASRCRQESDIKLSKILIEAP